MTKNLSEDMERLCLEMERLRAIQASIEAVNRMRKIYANVIAISPQKYNEFLHTDRINGNTYYFIFKPETGQYIDGYVE